MSAIVKKRGEEKFCVVIDQIKCAESPSEPLFMERTDTIVSFRVEDKNNDRAYRQKECLDAGCRLQSTKWHLSKTKFCSIVIDETVECH